MICDIDVIHGGESQIGYYVGLMVRPVFVLLPNIGFKGSGAFHVLHAQTCSFPLESDVGPNWAQASHLHWVDELLGVDVLVWIIPDVMEHRTEVTLCGYP